jgi:predicted MPP superfamily phosphohydrolase
MRWIFFFLLFWALDSYFYFHIRSLFPFRGFQILYWLIPVALWLSFFSLFFLLRGTAFPYSLIKMVTAALILWYVPKLIAILPYVLEDLISLLFWFAQKGSSISLSRRNVIHAFALTLFVLPFFAFLHGIWVGKYRLWVRRLRFRHPLIPEKLKGLRIVQISDLHLGSWDGDTAFMEKAVETINRLNPHLVVMTGDWVNNLAEEMKPFIPLLQRIQAQIGKWGILGNHDYGIYMRWKTPQDRERNLTQLKSFIRQCGFALLNNSHQVLQWEGEPFVLVGVENWGYPPFPQYGDLDKAMEGVPQGLFTILLSHDPSHWEAKVLPSGYSIPLTLSGHTHGMQFGIELGKWRWSPVQWRYSRWADLYQEGDRFLYVNRGLGFIGFPGRVGIYPEITLIELT